jgi:hypothetical protein
MYYTGGFIDRVYPWTILNDHHLRRLVGATTFADWVAADPARGTLEPYFPGRWLWRVPQDRVADITQTLRQAEIIPDGEKHYQPWMGAFSGRFMRGDIDPAEVLAFLMAQTRRDGRPPPPPRHEKVGIVNHVAVWDTDEKAVTRYLKEWGHPAGDLPEPPPQGPMTAEQIVGQVLGGLGFESPEDAEILRVKGGKATKLSDAEAAKLLPTKKPRKREK